MIIAYSKVIYCVFHNFTIFNRGIRSRQGYMSLTCLVNLATPSHTTWPTTIHESHTDVKVTWPVPRNMPGAG